MAKLYLICGKICSGKTYYSDILKEKLNAVVLSPDEATYDLIQNEQGEQEPCTTPTRLQPCMQHAS